jgi:phosphohistidine phosphatase
MWIYLLRHGNAEDLRPGQGDDDRALTLEGEQRLERAGPTWRRLVGPPDVVLVSPLRRARQTADAFVKAVRFAGEVRVESALVPSASPMLAVALLEAESLAQTGSVAVVGHEPHLGYLLGAMVTGNPRITMPLKKGMLVGVETDSVTSLRGELRLCLTQKSAARLT